MMTRDDFLKELRIFLQGRISQVKINEHLRYYENYIIEESRKGRSEAEVLESLGSPRLIAKTIAEVMDEDADDFQPKKPHSHGKAGRIFGVAAVCLFAVLIWRIGIFLLPFLAAVFMMGAILYLVYLIFSGNKK